MTDLSLAHPRSPRLDDQAEDVIPALEALGYSAVVEHLRATTGEKGRQVRAALLAIRNERDLYEGVLYEIIRTPRRFGTRRSAHTLAVQSRQAVASLRKQLRAQQRRAQFALADLAVAEGRKPDPAQPHIEAAFAAVAAEHGLSRAERVAAARSRKLSPMRLMGGRWTVDS